MPCRQTWAMRFLPLFNGHLSWFFVVVVGTTIGALMCLERRPQSLLDFASTSMDDQDDYLFSAPSTTTERRLPSRDGRMSLVEPPRPRTSTSDRAKRMSMADPRERRGTLDSRRVSMVDGAGMSSFDSLGRDKRASTVQGKRPSLTRAPLSTASVASTSSTTNAGPGDVIMPHVSQGQGLLLLHGSNTFKRIQIERSFYSYSTFDAH